MEAEAAKTNFPIIGPACGYFCYLVTRLSGARNIFELGSGFGYSTAWFARGVQENGGGVVHHTVWDAELSARARRHLTALGLDRPGPISHGRSRRHSAETRRVPSISSSTTSTRRGTRPRFPSSIPKLRAGGVLIVDNLLWSGKVLDQGDRSADTEGVRELTRLIMNDPRWIASIVPIRDGLLFATRR